MYELQVIYNYLKSNNCHKIHLLKHYNFNNMNNNTNKHVIGKNEAVQIYKSIENYNGMFNIKHI